RFGKRFVSNAVRDAYPLGGGVGPVSPFWRLEGLDPV
ncbi:MAG TPA: bifunctional hydroxymethylpyrimidine kinase/phosphomethylpyrimidine kinase, partial [Pseudonocardiaceae bacterium]|nr:bifunctional hydroxymethylpyrimidine kinase/phosphomethylpyrimidine kinase [Pseudonocardiaceae bacterium]